MIEETAAQHKGEVINGVAPVIKSRYLFLRFRDKLAPCVIYSSWTLIGGGLRYAVTRTINECTSCGYLWYMIGLKPQQSILEQATAVGLFHPVFVCVCCTCACRIRIRLNTILPRLSIFAGSHTLLVMKRITCNFSFRLGRSSWRTKKFIFSYPQNKLSLPNQHK